MTMRYTAVRSAILASAFLGMPALAQDRVAIFSGVGEGAEILYVAPGDPRARSAFAAAPEAKAPLVATVAPGGDGIEVTYLAATSVHDPSAFTIVPMSFGLGGGTPSRGLDTGPWSTGQ